MKNKTRTSQAFFVLALLSSTQNAQAQHGVMEKVIKDMEATNSKMREISDSMSKDSQDAFGGDKNGEIYNNSLKLKFKKIIGVGAKFASSNQTDLDFSETHSTNMIDDTVEYKLERTEVQHDGTEILLTLRPTSGITRNEIVIKLTRHDGQSLLNYSIAAELVSALENLVHASAIL